MWDVTDLYASTEGWAIEYDRIKSQAQQLEAYKGTLGASAGAMRNALDAISQVSKEASRLYTYASLKADEDLSNPRNQERRQQAGALNTLLAERTAWVAPEILSLGGAIVEDFEKEDQQLASRHGFYLSNVLRAAPHTLGLEAESVLAGLAVLAHLLEDVLHLLAGQEPVLERELREGAVLRRDHGRQRSFPRVDRHQDRTAPVPGAT